MGLNSSSGGEFDITIFGQPVIDHVIDLEDPFRYGELMKIVDEINSDGEVVFKEGSYIKTFENDEYYCFGMPLKYPDGTLSLKLAPKKKVTVTHLESRGVVASLDLVARLGKPFVYIGGGGPNALRILNQVFGKLSIEFIGAYCSMPGQAIDQETIDPSIKFGLETLPSLLQGISPKPKRYLKLVPIYDTVPVNIVVEGMRGDGGEDRGIIKSPFSEKIIKKMFNPKGKAIMVNTVYSKTLAVNALCCAIEDGRFGVLALTESLCNIQDPFTNEEKVWIKNFLDSKNMDIDFSKIKTLYEFILEKIIPAGPAVIIMNESELDHILDPGNETYVELASLSQDVQFPGDLKEKVRYDTLTSLLIFKGGMSEEERDRLLGLSSDTSYRVAIEALFQMSQPHPVTKQRRVKILEKKLVHLDSLLEGFEAIRNLQKKKHSKIYVTLGEHGSLCLDEKDIVHYSPVTKVEGIPSKGKNAIGDTYAAMILAGEYVSRFKNKAVGTPHIISAAAATADALFYTGFKGVAPATVDEYLIKTFTNYKDDVETGNYHELGPLLKLKGELKDLPFTGAPHIRLSDIPRKDWFAAINPRGPKLMSPYRLTDIYGVEFLTLLAANGVIKGR